MSTLDVQITSPTTATASWPEGKPVTLTAGDRAALSTEIYRFSQRRAAAVGAPVEVSIIDGGRRRGVTVNPDGTAAASTPSEPIPVVDRTSGRPVPAAGEAPEPSVHSAHASGPDAAAVAAAEPVVMSAEAIGYAAEPTTPPPEPSRVESAVTADSRRPITERTADSTAVRQEQPAPPPPTSQPHSRSTGAPSTPLAPSPSPYSTAPAASQRPVASQRTLPPLANRGAAAVTAFEPAKRGLRGRLNSALHLKLAPKADSAEMRLRTAAATIATPIPEFRRVAVANLKGGVGKTPLALGLASTLAFHRGAGTVVCADLAEVGGSLGDRAANPPAKGQNVAEVLAASSEIDRRPAALTRYLTRQPTGEDIVAGRQGLAGAAPLTAEQAAELDAIVSRQREILIADTGNNQLAGCWQWAVSHAAVLVVPVPLRRDAAIAAVRMLIEIDAIDPGVLARTVVIVTDGPGDQPMVETEAVDAFLELHVARVLRMPYEPLFAGGEPIVHSQLRETTVESLTVIAATVVELMTASH
ncbi:ParA family protein [Nocardia farcinica]|uniref:ParA family protein n=1 Tax=Nocardia TaxID=1817 RepID=UPI001892DFCA|nr:MULTISPECIES: ParA family protein [Nocardia]MBF6215668.1 ParA family protein [Nocardia puris]MBF6422361.1 ParA family protein [Nocardia farcinica]MBF6434062.1 ParA family protein [Nocardia farcinica]MBF6505118.1 ParA family protein [Nocardia farcinica]